MSALLDKVRAESRDLSPDEKLLLGIELIDSASMDESDLSSQEAISDAWDVEIQRRVEEIRSGKAKLVPLSEALARINSKFGWDS